MVGPLSLGFGLVGPISLLTAGTIEFTHLAQSQTHTGYWSNVIYGLLIASVICGALGQLQVHWHFRFTDPGVWMLSVLATATPIVHLYLRTKQRIRAYRTMDIVDMAIAVFLIVASIAYIERRLQHQPEPGPIS